SYGEVFLLKRSRHNKDKNRDLSAGSDRGTKRRKSSKDAESSRDSRSRKRSLQVPLKTPPNLDIILLVSLPIQRSQVIVLKTQAYNKIRSSSQETMINNPLTRRLPKPSSLRNLNDIQLLILIGIRDDKLTFDLLKPGLVKLCMLKNLPLHLMSSMILHLIFLHLS
nr:hypothetical protein [Tanacetum cinerariifolium]